MSQYVKCVDNRVYFKGFEGQTYGDLEIGKVYKVFPFNEQTDIEGMVRVRGEWSNEPGAEDGYLYPVRYFEPFDPMLQEQATSTLTIHLPPDLRLLLHAEALSQGKSMSLLLREWATERLDLPS